MATLHALVCVVGGVFVALKRPPRQIAQVIAYIAGSEVLWRMTRAGVFHETGKYAISLIILLALLRMRARRNRLIAIGYFCLLLPSVLLTAMDFDGDTRQVISTNMSGPLALALCVIFFSNIRLSGHELRNLFVAFIGPALAIGTLAMVATSAIDDLEFGRNSMRATSGGFGPNQVSSMLGLGLLFVVLLLFDRKQSWQVRFALFGLAIALAVPAALTFSRSGLLLAFSSGCAAMTVLIRDARTRFTLMLSVVILILVGNFVVVPKLEQFTQGKLVDRYTRLDSTGRTEIMRNDIEIFLDNPILGVGPGGAAELRREEGHHAAAHTEFTRMLADHGILGGFAIVLLLVIAARTNHAARTIEARGFVRAMITWAFLFLTVNAMRVAAPSLMFGLACTVSFSSLPPPRSKPAIR